MDKCIVLINSIFEIGALLKIVEAFIGHRKRKVSIIIMLLVMLGTSIYISMYLVEAECFRWFITYAFFVCL